MATGARRWWALAALALSALVVGLDLTVLNLALPTLATALHASTSDLQWIVDAYSLVLAAMMLPAGMLGDRFGRKKLLLGVLLLTLSVLPVLFAEEERQRAITISIGATLVAFPVGPLLGGWLLTHYWWGSVFLINGPVIALALLAVAVLLPESRSARSARFDVPGMVVSSAGLVGLTYGAIEAGQEGWGDARALTAMAAGALVLAGFVAWERRVSRRPGGQPLVDLPLFRSAGFTWGTILATTVSFAMFGLLFTVPQYFQAVVGTDALGAGLRLLPMIGGLILGAAVADRLGKLAGAKVTVALGFALMAAALGTGATTAVGSGDRFALAWVGLLGVGLGFAMPGAMDAALGALSAERSGVGSALITALRQVGAAIGVAVLGTVLNSGYHGRLDVAGLPAPVAGAVRDSVAAGVAVAHQLGSQALLLSVRTAFVHGMDLLLLVCGGIALVGVLLTLAFLPRRGTRVDATSGELATSAGEQLASR